MLQYRCQFQPENGIDMEPSGPTSGIPPTQTSPQRPVSLPLQVGQQLLATVLDNSAGKILLAIGHRQLSAESSLPFERGQALTLQVSSLGKQPVLRVITALQESPIAMAVRALLPRYGASTPLLASLSQLAQAPQAPVPPLVREAARALLRQLPEVATLSTPRGVKTAVQHSGGFLESHLARAGQTTSTGLIINSDYKANLVRLVQLLRQWPGSSNQAPTLQKPAGEPTAARPTAPVTPTPSPTSAGNRVLSQPPGASPQPGAPLPSTPLNPPTSPPSPAPPTSATTHSTMDPQSTPATKPKPQSTPPQTIQRAIQNSATPATARLAPATTPAATGTLATPTGSSQAANPLTPTAGLNPPPPFSGIVPTPQASVQASLDLLNRLGNLRLDLLQQTEAALARVHLNQLASLPREGEHRLVEWLFDIPVRRGNDVDFWSARLFRDTDGDTKARDTAPAQWSVQLAFDLPGLGPMQAQINLHGERVSTHFWATREETLPLVHGNLKALRRNMLEVGLEVGDIDCRLGAIPETPGRNQAPLIREKV